VVRYAARRPMRFVARVATCVGVVLCGSLALAACATYVPDCYRVDSETLDYVATNIPGGVPLKGAAVPGPDSDGYFVLAMQFSVDGVRHEGVWGHPISDKITSIDATAREWSAWPDAPDGQGVGPDSLEARTALACLRGDG
jgi:hypothetical protein